MEVSSKIIDYAIWYYLRYYPSKKKLFRKIQEKFGPQSENGKKYGGLDDETIERILSEKMRNIIQEEEVCFSKIKTLIEKNKKISYIKNNLFQKQFEAQMIEDILINAFEYHEQSLLDDKKLEKKILDLKRKGKSINFIKQQLIERTLDREVVELKLGEIFPKGDLENLRKEYEKLRGKVDEQKLVEKLLRKGFCYGDIKLIQEDEGL